MSDVHVLYIVIVALQGFILSLTYLIILERRQVAKLKLALKVSQQFGGINPAKVAAYNRITPDQIKAARAFDPEAGGKSKMVEKYQVFTLTAKLRIPTVPNFLLTENGTSLPLSAFDVVGLRQIAEAWTEELLDNAHRQRGEAAKDPK